MYLFYLLKLKREERKNMAVGVKEGVDGILMLLNLFIITYSLVESVYNWIIRKMAHFKCKYPCDKVLLNLPSNEL